MPRLARIDVPGLPQHLVQRGIDRQPCFFPDESRRRYLADLRDIALKRCRPGHALAWLLPVLGAVTETAGIGWATAKAD